MNNAKIPRHTSKNAITEGDFKYILHVTVKVLNSYIYFKNTLRFPQRLDFRKSNTRCTPSPESDVHWKISADGKPHEICNIRIHKILFPVVVCCDSCSLTSKTSTSFSTTSF